MSEEKPLTQEVFEAGIREDRTVEGHTYETYYCPFLYATEGEGFLCFVGDNDATNVEIRVPFTLLEQNGWQRATERTYTAADIERIVAIACREQRYKCVDAVTSRPRYGLGDSIDGVIQNAPAPIVADVLAEFKKLNGEKG